MPPRYGDAGDRYPVKPGELWAVGQHRVLCSDINDPIVDRFITSYRPTLIYSDPPWDNGNARAFRTKAGLDDGPVDITRLWERITDVCVKLGAPSVFLEIGNSHVAEMLIMLCRKWRSHIFSWPITYYRKHHMWLIATSSHIKALELRLDTLDDEDTPPIVIEALTKPGDTVVDVCCGQGLTAVSAAKLRRMFAGIELNPRRAAVTLDKLAKLTNQSPHPIEFRS